MSTTRQKSDGELKLKVEGDGDKRRARANRARSRSHGKLDVSKIRKEDDDEDDRRARSQSGERTNYTRGQSIRTRSPHNGARSPGALQNSRGEMDLKDAEDEDGGTRTSSSKPYRRRSHGKMDVKSNDGDGDHSSDGGGDGDDYDRSSRSSRSSARSPSPHKLKDKVLSPSNRRSRTSRSNSPGTYRGDLARKRGQMKELRERAKSQDNLFPATDDFSDEEALTSTPKPRRARSIVWQKEKDDTDDEDINNQSLNDLLKQAKKKAAQKKSDDATPKPKRQSSQKVILSSGLQW